MLSVRKHLRLDALPACIALLSLVCGGPMAARAAAVGDLIIDNVRIVDARSTTPPHPVSVLVRGGRIEKIGTASDRRIRRIDGAGMYLSPGLIDAHVHMMWSPACAMRYDAVSSETWARTCGHLLPHYLKAYLASGVTTIVDNAVPDFVTKHVAAVTAATAAAPRYLCYAPVLGTPGGYGDPPPFADQNFVPVASPGDVAKAFERPRSGCAVGVKVLLESGFLPSIEMPTYQQSLIAEIGRQARTRGLRIFVHVSSERDMRRAFALEPRAFVHTLIGRYEDLHTDFIAEVRRRGIFQVTTLQTTDSYLNEYAPQRLRSPLLHLVVPPAELEFAREPGNAERAKDMLAGGPDGLSYRVVRDLLEHAVGPAGASQSLATSERAVAALAKAGVPIVLGSDTPHHPFALYSFHGASSRRELQLLRDAGFAPDAVLRAATLAPAQMLGIDADVGTVEEGKVADLLLSTKNPAADATAYDTIALVIRAGIARTPAEWMKSSGDVVDAGDAP